MRSLSSVAKVLASAWLIASGAIPARAQPLASEEALLAPASGSAARGGAALAIDGDFALVGVPGIGNATTSGAVYVYRRTAPAVWMLEQTIADPEPTASHSGDTFGASVAISGSTAIVGDPGHAGMVGQAWILTRGTGTSPWTSARIAAPASAPTRFGSAVAIAPSFLAVGAPDSGGGRSGAVFLFDTSGALRSAQITTPAGITGAGLFGSAVALSAPPSAAISLLVGAPGANQVYAYALTSVSATDWVLGPTITAPSSGKFGASVALAPGGLVAAIGAPEESGHGAVYVLGRASPSDPWSDIGTAAHPSGTDTQASDHFGQSVAASDDAVVAGAPNHDGASGDTGGVYLFLRDATGGGWHEASRYRASGGMSGDQLGVAVGVSMRSIVGGAPRPTSTLGYAAVFPFPLERGVACTLDERCGSGFCVDDVCCDVVCGDGATDDCVACSVAAGAATDGTCGAARETMSCSSCGGAGSCTAGTCSSSTTCDAGATVDGGSDDGGGVRTDAAASMPVHHVSGCKCSVGGARGPTSGCALVLVALFAFSIRRSSLRRSRALPRRA